MVMSPDSGGVFDVLLTLVRRGLGGSAGSGDQFVSWIHEADFTRALDFIIDHDSIEGHVNIASPNPLPNRDFMRILRESAGVPFGLSTNRFLLELGAIFMRTETELILKSRRVIPGALHKMGFHFQFPAWKAAANDLIRRGAQTDARVNR
jgi:NAD dependent epimerase/dehydratase family enzyme